MMEDEESFPRGSEPAIRESIAQRARREDAPSLVERLEVATGGSAALDCEIACLIKFPHLRPARPDDFDGRYGDYTGYLKVEHGFLLPDRYTRSLDAALTLVPERLGWNIQGNSPVFHARAGGFAGKGATPALALTIAALKARLA